MNTQVYTRDNAFGRYLLQYSQGRYGSPHCSTPIRLCRHYTNSVLTPWNLGINPRITPDNVSSIYHVFRHSDMHYHHQHLRTVIDVSTSGYDTLTWVMKGSSPNFGSLKEAGIGHTDTRNIYTYLIYSFVVETLTLRKPKRNGNNQVSRSSKLPSNMYERHPGCALCPGCPQPFHRFMKSIRCLLSVRSPVYENPIINVLCDLWPVLVTNRPRSSNHSATS
jgi:hypothetical protein